MTYRWRSKYLPYFIFSIFLLSLSKPFLEKISSYFIEKQLTPSDFLQQSMDGLFKKILPSSQNNKLALQLHQLELENYSLKKQVGFFADTITNILQYHTPLKNRIYGHYTKMIDMYELATPASIVSRNQPGYGHFIWIDLGKSQNLDPLQPIIGKYSPVIFGQSVVGIVEHVGEKYSKVRLITDPMLKIAVRASRALSVDNHVVGQLSSLINTLQSVEPNSYPAQRKQSLIQELSILNTHLLNTSEPRQLAKGVVSGNSNSKRELELRGSGFNYDFSDEYGVARDLRTGSLLKEFESSSNTALIYPNDLLITSGFDKIFPEGLVVGYVKEVLPLKEGGNFYDLIARPAIQNLSSLSTVFVMPPMKLEEGN